MLLYIILDLQKNSWKKFKHAKSLYNNILVLINTFIRLSYDNKVIVVNNRPKKEFDRNNPIAKNVNDQVVTKIFEYNEFDSMANDIGYKMALAKDFTKTEILIVSLSREREKRLFEISKKHSFVARRYKEKFNIHVFSYYNNPKLSEIGHFYNNFELTSFISILSTIEPKKNIFSLTKCSCHSKEILYRLVCPVSLSIYCSFIPVCKKCRIKFDLRNSKFRL